MKRKLILSIFLLCCVAGLLLAATSPQFILQMQNAGTNIGTWFNYVNINCSTGMSCSASGSTVTMTASGGGGTVTSVTFTGDGVFDSSTPSTAVTTTGTVPATVIAQTGNCVFASPSGGGSGSPSCRTLVTGDLPSGALLSGGALGTPSSGTLTNATGLPVAGLSNLGSNVGTFLVTPTAANFAAAVTASNAAGTTQGLSTYTNNGTTSGTQAPGCVPATTCGSWGGTSLPGVFGTVTAGTAGTTPGFIDIAAGGTTAAMSQQTTATCTNITGMTWNIKANKNYILRCEVPRTLAASATIAYCLGGPGTATSYTLVADGGDGAAGVWAQLSTLAQTAWGTKTTASSAVAADTVDHIWASVRNGSTASGTALTLQTAANGTNGITVGQDATCQLTQIN